MVSLDELIQRMESAAPATSAFAAALEFAGKTFLEAMMAKPPQAMAKGISTEAENVHLGEAKVMSLHDAVRAGDEGLVRDLLERSAPIDAIAADGINAGEAPIHVAVDGGQVAMVQLLVASGANRNLKSVWGETPLVMAVRGDRLDMAEALLNGAHVDRLGYLREHAGPAGEGDELGKSPLAWAAEKGCVEMVQKLIEHGMNLNHLCPTINMTPTHVAAEENHADVIDVIAKAGGDLELSNTKGCTPLITAATRLNVEAAIALVRNGASTTIADKLGFTPLHMAASMAGTEGGAARMVELLLQWGADDGATSVRDFTPYDIVGLRIPKGEQVAEDVERVRKLLSKASAVRKAWVRRGLLVMARSRPDLLKLSYHPSDDSGVWQEIEDTCWIDVAARVIDLEEEGIFRLVVEYL